MIFNFMDMLTDSISLGVLLVARARPFRGHCVRAMEM